MALSLQEKPLFQNNKFLDDTCMFLLTLYFHTHPLTLLLEILRGRIHGPSPHPNLKLWGPFPYSSAYSCAYEIQIPQMTPTILCYVPQSFERLVPTTPSFQTRTHDPPIFQIRLIPLA